MLENQVQKALPKPQYRLLIVEDEESLGSLLVEYFTQKKYQSYHVPNASDALKYMKNNHVDVVITNINMPGMNGIELTEIIRRRYSSRVIIFTGYVSSENRKRAFHKGAHAFLTKPAPIDVLCNLVEKLTKEDVVYIG